MLRTVAIMALGVSGVMAGAIRGQVEPSEVEESAAAAAAADGGDGSDDAAPAEEVLGSGEEQLDASEEDGYGESDTDIAAAKKGERNWAKPNMEPLGYFKKRAGLTSDGLNQTVLETTYVPTMIPQDGFKISSAKLPKDGVNKTEVAKFQPPMVGHGELRALRQKEDHAEDAEVEGDINKKENELRRSQSEGACAMMENALSLARAARDEEAAMENSEGKVLVDIVKMVCPALKYRYSYVMRCKKCSDMVSRLEKFYDRQFDTKTFPGLSHPDKCDHEKWPLKNFALEAALSSPNLFFGVDFCARAEDEEMDTEEASEDVADSAGGEDESEDSSSGPESVPAVEFL